MKKFKAKWQEQRIETDLDGEETDRYFVGRRDVCEAENEDEAYKIFCERHPIGAEYGFEDIVELTA